MLHMGSLDGDISALSDFRLAADRGHCSLEFSATVARHHVVLSLPSLRAAAWFGAAAWPCSH
ncbi:hypothetical protein E2562_004885 [Oryza meyeriana var. granulata]|uniref:Uncharacterized protein n=1 Tax=Oryza meyeriana var. granulata TaxID=110450 RepID=A0A6G1C4I5_9ORYZ|nr:hypothetical protein E2562_004885 [Oryza meyeriana var. granulata]